MTYHQESRRGTKRVLTALVIITIGLVAYWAATGGLDQIGLTG